MCVHVCVLCVCACVCACVCVCAWEHLMEVKLQVRMCNYIHAHVRDWSGPVPSYSMGSWPEAKGPPNL